MALTSAQQRNAVSQGAALGMLLCGRTELPPNKVNVDLAFEAAFRDWEYRDRFSQVKTDLARGLDASIALTRADESTMVAGVHWTTDGNRRVIRSRDPEWRAENPDDVDYALKMIKGDVPLDGWVSLAKAFLSRLDR